ncbi:MAG TPA: ATP-binding protein [Bacilli bacterium]|nr:ATP-binding protein [Bacilli bacterium]
MEKWLFPWELLVAGCCLLIALIALVGLRVTYRRELERQTEAKATFRQLVQTDKLNVVGELAAGIAHEIRNPLTSLRGFVQLLQTETKPEQVKQYSTIMLGEIDRINLIVSELLLLAKPEQLNIVRKSVSELLDQTITLMNTQAILYNIEISVDATEVAGLEIDCEENKLKQVFINLLKNAIEAMPQGGHIAITADRLDDKVLIRFSDQGCGIPPEHLPKLGQAFFTSKEKGTGLGLMISYSIIENHKGCMHIDSEAGQGTVVEIRLPLPAY